MAPAVVMRRGSAGTAQALGGAARRRNVHLRWHDGPAGAQRLLEVGRAGRLLVLAQEQTWPGTAARARRLSAA